jgi:hypothetical protein
MKYLAFEPHPIKRLCFWLNSEAPSPAGEGKVNSSLAQAWVGEAFKWSIRHSILI